MPHGEGSMGFDDPSVKNPENNADTSMHKFKPETDAVSDAAQEALSELEGDRLETQKAELLEKKAEFAESIKELEGIQNNVCSAEKGPDWKDKIDEIMAEGDEEPAAEPA